MDGRRSTSEPPRGVEHTEAAIDLALSHHQAGRAAEAERGYRRVLVGVPDHPDALHLLGLLLHQAGRPVEAEPLVKRAITLRPDQAMFHTHLGLILASLGQAEAGIACHRRATALDPRSADAHNNLGVALAAAGRPADAIECYRRAVAIRPDVLSFDNLGRSLHTLGRSTEAAAAFREAIAIDARFAPAHNGLGMALRAVGSVEGAIAAFRRAAELSPTSPEPLDNLGNALQQARRPAEAMACCEAALALQPGRPSTLNLVGTLQCDAGRWADAIVTFERALAGRPDFVDAVNNLGTALEEVGRREEAMVHYRRAAALAPDAVSPPWNVALLQLLTGDYTAGWPGYEHRWRQRLQRSVHRQFGQPMWDGSDLGGRRLLLHAEQGFGDALQFARYAALAASRGGRVFVECHPPLARLFRSLAGVDRVVPRGEGPLPPFDVHCPFMSLPMVFGTTLATVPAEVPYLRATPAAANRWRRRLAAEPPGRRVGLVWSGDAKHQKDRDRSVLLAMLAPLAAAPGVRFYSLQFGPPAEAAAAPPPGMSLTDWTGELDDFADTAGLASQLDLVVTVDTAVAHLAGALGRPTWVLVPFAPDWRWLLDRDDSPWYPTMRLFRQRTKGDWAHPIARVAEALRAWGDH
jgi:Flp pilus assembly protein TadD